MDDALFFGEMCFWVNSVNMYIIDILSTFFAYISLNICIIMSGYTGVRLSHTYSTFHSAE